jgi:hypothetical protein
MFILRTTTPPSIQKLLELERTVIVDNAGVNIPAGVGTGQACLVAEFPQGPFAPTVVQSSGDVQNLFMGPDATKFSLISQSGFDPSSAVQDGSGVTFDGNGWAELKGKTFSGLVIQRVDCDAVAGDSSVVKSYVAFTVTVALSDQVTGGTYGKTSKDIVIPSGLRFADAASVSGATNVLALSQQITIPAGTTLTAANALAIAVSFTQNAQTGALTYTTTSPTIGATAFFVKGTAAAIAAVAYAIDTVIPNFASTIASTGISTIGLSGAAAVHAPAGGGAAPSPDTLSNRITANYAAAIDKTLPGNPATNNIIAIWSARNYQMTATGAAKALRLYLWATNAVAASNIGRGRVACVTAVPVIGLTATAALTTAFGLYAGQVASDVVTGSDADRYWLSGPYVQVFSQELNAAITISACGFRAAMKVNLFNNGQSEYLSAVGQPYNSTIQNISAQEPGFAANPLPADTYYVTLKAAGVAWLIQDRTAGWWFYSGVTAANPVTNANRVDDNRRSFADEVEDEIFALASNYSKLPGTTERQDAFTSDMRVYLDEMVNPPPGIDQRAKQYQVLDGQKAGNTDTLNGQGIYLFSASVVMNGSMKAIMITAAIGPTVIITQVS